MSTFFPDFLQILYFYALWMCTVVYIIVQIKYSDKIVHPWCRNKWYLILMKAKLIFNGMKHFFERNTFVLKIVFRSKWPISLQPEGHIYLSVAEWTQPIWPKFDLNFEPEGQPDPTQPNSRTWGPNLTQLDPFFESWGLTWPFTLSPFHFYIPFF